MQKKSNTEASLDNKLKYEISERKRAEEELERRNKLLSTLLEVSNLVSSTLELKPLLEAILDRLKTIIEYKGARVFIVSGNYVRLFAHRSSLTPEQEKEYAMPVDVSPIWARLVREGKPLVIEDIYGDEPLAASFRSTLGKNAESFFKEVRSWMGLPMIIKDRVIGVLALDHTREGYYNAYHIELGTAFANQAAIEYENAKLYNENARMYYEEHRRHLEDEQSRHVAESLRDILAILNSNRPLDELLDFIIKEAARLMGTDSGVLCHIEGDGMKLVPEAACGLPYVHVKSQCTLPGENVLLDAVRGRKPIAAPGIFTEHHSDILALPLICKDEVYGGIALYFRKSQTFLGEPRDFSKDELDLAMAFAGQAALALDNSRLRTQAEEMAVAAERNRIARDLHDAVTQTLFSASLIAEVLPKIWERSPGDGVKRLEELRQLTRGALAEMRTLLFELRPATLAEAALPDLLRQLAEASAGRARIPVALSSEGNVELPTEVKIAFYRIAQEALNNISKHSDASAAEIKLTGAGDKRARSRKVEMKISDDGRGFDPGAVTAEHFGVGIMRERAQAAGARLTVDGRPGKGTEITLIWESA